ncbi:MAG: aspartate-semialdehyde dehydrogenase [Marinilabiliaceae bacterium]|jgi:aspartate-semialdehyde dehydrogenase|nr:aspartate-semialdehyde dehydrogenase [Marinilabiliaceae bacterium]
MKVAVVGVTGMVGQVMLRVLEERNFPVKELIPAASQRSVGREIIFNKLAHKVVSVEEAIERVPGIALFSAGGSTSQKYAPLFAEKGTVVIDNSSAWRMNDDVPLTIPEVNPGSLKKHPNIIANPNCSTIQMLMALAPLHHSYKIKRIVVSTYQSVSGSGVKATRQLQNEREGRYEEMAYPHPIHNNCLPQCAEFDAEGYTTEEQKLLNETRKILDDYSIGVSATAVRVPVTGGHSESVNVEFYNDFDLAEVRSLLSKFPGVVVEDDPANNLYPMPVNAYGRDEVFVGRIRRDFSQANTLNMWIVADNIRKGAATNAVQIAELLLKQ